MTKERPIVDTHCVDIYPPDNGRNTWMAVCSFKDLSRQYRTRLDAIEAASQHGLQVVKRAVLEQGYDFDATPYGMRFNEPL